MRKQAFLLCIFTVLLLCLSINVAAHSGGTDSNGGHRGDDGYHYHHGYPAHDHWDMDGDGDLDCPYNFNDKTGQNSGGGSSGGSSSGGSSSSKPTNTNQKDEGFDPDKFMSNFLTAGVVIPLVLAFVLYFFNEKIAKAFVFLTLIILLFSMILYPILKIIAWFS